MSEKLRDYQVIDVLCGGGLYKVRHKNSGEVFVWRAFDYSGLADGKAQKAAEEARRLCDLNPPGLRRVHGAVLHAPSRTLYVVLQHLEAPSVLQLSQIASESNKRLTEPFLWKLFHSLTLMCKQLEDAHFESLQFCLDPGAILIDEKGQFHVDCVVLDDQPKKNLLQQIAEIIQSLSGNNYSEDLYDVISLLLDNRSTALKPEVILRHPTVLSNLDLDVISNELEKITECLSLNSHSNLCDSEKAVELCKAVEETIPESPIYCNISSVRSMHQKSIEANSVSPTVAALALELPGFVPRSRKPIADALCLEAYNSPQRVSQTTLSQQWMSRLIALRQREESLNKRERDLIAKEIANSPSVKVIPLKGEVLVSDATVDSNGITLPPLISQLAHEEVKLRQSTRRTSRRASSSRTRKPRKSYAYEDLDSSLSADPGDGSMIVTAKKITKENMPRRSIFPESKKVHFTSVNPFTDSDESVTLTFYELDGKKQEKLPSDISKFKYLDLEKAALEKRAAMPNWSQSSPSKQPKITGKVFSDITNTKCLNRTPSKSSIASKSSNSTCKSAVSVESNCRQGTRLSMLPEPVTEVKKNKRRSLLPFKTPFKFISSK